MSSANRLLLDYHSVTLYAADVSTLAPHTWLNDNILSFWMDYLQHEVHAAQSERFRFVSPTTTMILMHEEGRLLAYPIADTSLFFLLLALSSSPRPPRPCFLVDESFSKLRRCHIAQARRSSRGLQCWMTRRSLVQRCAEIVNVRGFSELGLFCSARWGIGEAESTGLQSTSSIPRACVSMCTCFQCGLPQRQQISERNSIHTNHRLSSSHPPSFRFPSPFLFFPSPFN